MQRRRFVAACAAAPAFATYAQGGAATPELSAEQAQRDLRILKRAFADLHPGLFRYATAAQIEAEFGAAEDAVKAGSSRAAMFLLVSRLAAAVRCGHTWTNPYNQGKAIDELLARADKLPLTLRFVEGRALVTGSVAAGLPTGSELLAVDGRPISDIVAALLPCLRADGDHEGARGKRLAQLDSGVNGGAMDRLFPLRFPPQAGRYRLRFAESAGAAPREVDAPAVAVAMRDRTLPPESPQWAFRVEGEVATLTLPTFAFWRGDFKPDAYLARAFGAIRNVPYLVIDLRRNEGGDDATGRLLLSHLLREPAVFPGYRVESAYERVPYALARYLDTWDFGFFDRTGQVTKDPKSPGRNWQLPDRPGARVEPNALNYPGKVIALVGPQNSSAGFLVARAFKSTGAATLVGQTTGGNLRGLNGGQLAWITLPASGVGVDIPLLASVYPGDPPDAGVTPDVQVTPRFAEAQAGVDAEMRAAFGVISQWKGAAAPARP